MNCGAVSEERTGVPPTVGMFVLSISVNQPLVTRVAVAPIFLTNMLSHFLTVVPKSSVSSVSETREVLIATLARLSRAVVAPELPEALIVIESVDASVVMVTFVPATRVRVSEVESATTLDCPDTAIVENRFWSHVFVPLDVPEKVPD